MKENTLMQHIRTAAGKLKGCKLKRLNAMGPVLEEIRKEASLSTPEEALILVAIFDRQCSDCRSSLTDLSDYFDCAALDIMEFVPTVRLLVSKGYISAHDIHEQEITKMEFRVCTEVFSALVEGKPVKPTPSEAVSFDSYDFCKTVALLISKRADKEIDTRNVFVQTQLLEEKYAEMPFVTELKSLIDSIEARVLFYEIGYDFANDYEGGKSDLNLTLSDIYDRIVACATVKEQLLEDCHPLMKADLIELRDDDELYLAEKGVKLLFGEAVSHFVKSNVCKGRYAFVEKVADFANDFESSNFAYSDLRYGMFYRKIEHLEYKNEHLTVVTTAQKVLPDVKHRLIYYLVCKKAMNLDRFSVRLLRPIFEKKEEMEVKRAFKKGQHPLQKLELVELTKEDYIDDSDLQLTEKGKELFFEEDLDLFEEKISDKQLIPCDRIPDKRLFFEPTLERQLVRLKESLEETHYIALCRRLKEKNLPTGVAVLLYGLPGTGKTESVLQIARATGRAILHVDISATKTCWFGESEKLIKDVFTNYRRLCRKSKIKPILLFNEADAVFSKRKDSGSSAVAQTENAIQNIILEEMETLDGILIATTNLVNNLDKAFERRFLFKIRYDKPTLDSKTHIWQDKMPRLTEREAVRLASAYDFSGGEIDNIVRKATLEEVIGGSLPSMERLLTLCGEEKITKGSRKIGFS